MATTPPTTTRTRWVVAWAVPAALATAGALGLALLHQHTTAGWTVLLGDADDAVLEIHARTLLGLGTGGLLLVLAATIHRRWPRWPGKTTATLLITAVIAAWAYGGALTAWNWIWATHGNWVHLDTTGTDQHWVVEEIPALGDTTYGLYATTPLPAGRPHDLARSPHPVQ